MDYKECLEKCEKKCEISLTGEFSNYLNKCKNACPFFCECVQTCSSKQSIDYCDNFCSSYLNCEATCLEESNFCERVCKFDPHLNWIFLGFDMQGNAQFYYVENVDQNIAKVWVKRIFSNKGKQKYIKMDPKYKKIDQLITLCEIDCAEKKESIRNNSLCFRWFHYGKRY